MNPNILAKSMQKHIVYITTDANRVYLEAGYCEDITIKLMELQNSGSSFMIRGPKFSRIVHTEEFDSFEKAERRRLELNGYTRMQKEKIIRRYNPNWLSIHAIDTAVINKAAVYA